MIQLAIYCIANRKRGVMMTIEEILAGESKNVEFKENLPEKSIKYMKSVVAFANGTGGKIIFGIADKTREVVGFDKEDVFKNEYSYTPHKFQNVTNGIAYRRWLYQSNEGLTDLLCEKCLWNCVWVVKCMHDII